MIKITHVNLAKGFRGGERQTVLLIKALADFGCKQTLVCRTDSPMRKELESTKDLSFVSANNQLLGHFSLGHTDILHAHDAKAVHWVYIHSRFVNAPYVITRRINVPVKDKLFNRLTYRSAKGVVAVSSVIKNSIDDQGWNSAEVIYDSSSNFVINTDLISNIKYNWKNNFIVGHVGALVDNDKGQKIIIDAGRILRDRIPNLQIVFFGQGRDEVDLKKYSQGMDFISWQGFKTNIADYMSSFDVFVFPSRNEGLGSVLLDVMSLNVPIIATKVGGIPEIVLDQKTGLLIDSGSPEALANAIETLYLDAGLRAKLVANASVFVEKYSPKFMADKYMNLYNKII